MELTADEAARQIGDDATCYIRFGAERIITDVRVTRLAAPKAPPLWFGELRESAARPPAVVLLAFTGHGVREGALLDESALADTDVVSADQLGAVRWYPGTGEVDRIYVQPEWRRRSIAMALSITIGTIAAARDWPRLWGDGQRTELGEQWRLAQPWRDRAAPLTHALPPMTSSTAEGRNVHRVATNRADHAGRAASYCYR